MNLSFKNHNEYKVKKKKNESTRITKLVIESHINYYFYNQKVILLNIKWQCRGFSINTIKDNTKINKE